jgi:hypothetical protein
MIFFQDPYAYSHSIRVSGMKNFCKTIDEREEPITFSSISDPSRITHHAPNLSPDAHSHLIPPNLT